MTDWHARYDGRGVMIYWHVEKRATCVYSQLKRRSLTEVVSMIEGVLGVAPIWKSSGNMGSEQDGMAAALPGRHRNVPGL